MGQMNMNYLIVANRFCKLIDIVDIVTRKQLRRDYNSIMIMR